MIHERCFEELSLLKVKKQRQEASLERALQFVLDAIQALGELARSMHICSWPTMASTSSSCSIRGSCKP